MKRNATIAGLLAALLIVPRAGAVESSSAEKDAALEWVETYVGKAAAANPFSFIYDGRPSDSVTPKWRRTYTEEPEAAGKARRVLTWVDPETGIELTYTAVHYCPNVSTEQG